jgi:pimeloyl-ACP methyl ester carboxylesterase
MTQHVVSTEAADLVYDVTGRGPTLLMIAGAGGTGSIYRKSAELLGDSYTVVTYDRRANGQSSGDPTTMLDMAQQARDAASVITSTGADSAIVFGNSGGANIALKLTEDHPSIVEGLAVHEPPVVSILPDADVWATFINEVDSTRRRKGVRRAEWRFVRSGVGVNPLKLLLARGSGRPNLEFFLEREFVPISTYAPNIDDLRHADVPIIALAGRGSRDAYYARTARVLADQVPCRYATVSGNHFAFLLDPEVFAAELREHLASLRG